MSRKLAYILFSVLFVVFFTMPEVVFQGAKDGLLLWFHTVLPTLFPFLVITGLMVGSNTIYYVSRLFGKYFRSFFAVSDAGVFVVLCGFLCGYPMGAKLASDLVVSKRISPQEGAYLLSFCNNTSPAFIISYIFLQNLQRPELVLPSMVILIGTPVLCSFFFRRKHTVPAKTPFNPSVNPNTSEHSLSLLLDSSIMDNCDTITRIGGYIIVFCILSAVLKQFPVHGFIWDYLVIPAVEITRGISLLAQSPLAFSVKYVLIMALASFGGLCAVFQTQCMVKESSLSILFYIKEKLITAAVTSLISIIAIQFLI